MPPTYHFSSLELPGNSTITVLLLCASCSVHTVWVRKALLTFGWQGRLCKPQINKGWWADLQPRNTHVSIHSEFKQNPLSACNLARVAFLPTLCVFAYASTWSDGMGTSRTTAHSKEV